MKLAQPVWRLALLVAAVSFAPLKGQTQDTAPLLRFGVIGDMGVATADQKHVAARMLEYHRRNPLEFVITVGDNIYPGGDPSLFGPNFKDIYQPLFDEGVQFHASLGNHDVADPAAQDGAVQVQDPAFGYIGGEDEYVLEAGPMLKNGKRLARLICLNSVAWLRDLEEHDSSDLEKRSAKLDAWLAKSDGYQWNFLYFHHPLYSYVQSGWLPGRGHGSSKALREALEDRIVGKIDAVFTGHDHFYQKIKPQRGIHYFVTGGGGQTRAGMKKKGGEIEHAELALHFLSIWVWDDRFAYHAIDDRGAEFDTGVVFKHASIRPPVDANPDSAGR